MKFEHGNNFVALPPWVLLNFIQNVSRLNTLHLGHYITLLILVTLLCGVFSIFNMNVGILFKTLSVLHILVVDVNIVMYFVNACLSYVFPSANY